MIIIGVAILILLAICYFFSKRAKPAQKYVPLEPLVAPVAYQMTAPIGQQFVAPGPTMVAVQPPGYSYAPMAGPPPGYSYIQMGGQPVTASYY